MESANFTLYAFVYMYLSRMNRAVSSYNACEQRTFIAWIESSNSLIHPRTSDEVTVSTVSVSSLWSILEDTSTGMGLRELSGISKAIILRNGECNGTWTKSEYLRGHGHGYACWAVAVNLSINNAGPSSSGARFYWCAAW